MADITMCKGTNCKNRGTCYRFTAPVNEFRQSFFISIPLNEQTGQCDHFWDNAGRNQIQVKPLLG